MNYGHRKFRFCPPNTSPCASSSQIWPTCVWFTNQECRKMRRTIAFWCVMINRPTNCGTIASSGPQVSVWLAAICRWARTASNWFRETILSLRFYWPNGCLKGFRSCCWFHVMIIFRGNQCAYSGNSSPISRNGSTLVPTRVARRTVGCSSGGTSCQNLVHSWGKISTKIFLLKLTMTSPFP